LSWSLTLFVLVLAVLAAAGTLRAAPAETSGAADRTDLAQAQSMVVGPARVSLVATRSSVPVGEGFSYTATVRYSEPLEYLEARMRIRYPTGRLIYQKTFVEQSLEPGVTSFVFERGLADIGLPPGVYPLELSVRVSADGVVSDDVIESELRIYDPERTPLPVALVGRVSAQPLTDPEGRFAFDPGEYTRARDDVAAVAAHILARPDARLTLALSPLMLEEWQRVAAGYRLAGAEGDIEFGPDDSTPEAYAATLEELRRAVGTGRLEVMSLGYSDPDLSELGSADMLADIPDQYALGTSVCFAALGSQPSVGTAPAGGSVPEGALPPLAEQDIDYVVVDEVFARTGDGAAGSARPGRYQAGGSGLIVLVADSRSLLAPDMGSSEQLISTVFERHMTYEGGEPSPFLATVGPGSLEVRSFLAAAGALESEPWVELRTGVDSSEGTGAPSVRLIEREADPDAPSDYWTTVRESRRWSEALTSAMTTGTAVVEQANRDSLISQGSAWAGVAGEWMPAWRGLAFANHALRASESVLGEVRLDVKPVTLAGTSGEVPVTITSDSTEVLELSLVQKADSSVNLGSPATDLVTVSPGENFLELPVELVGVLSSNLEVSLYAADVELAADSVRVRASYLDRLAIVLSVVLVLGGLLVFIIMRVRAAQAAAADASNGTRR
jgi:hypothetical protein